jgi:cytoskeletal protein CcmA (bactofilin family)
MKLNTFGGVVRRGNYDAIIAQGWCRFEHGVTFNNLIVRGVVEIESCQGGQVVMQSGVLHCNGDLNVDAIEGTGNVEIHGSLRCQRIALTGSMICEDMIRTDANVEVYGAIQTRSLTTPESTRIIGHGIIDSIDVRHLDVKPIHSAMFERFGLKEYLTPSCFELIEADTAQLHWVQCRKIVADTIELTGSSKVGEVVYTKRFRHDASSSSTLTRLIGLPTHSRHRRVA